MTLHTLPKITRRSQKRKGQGHGSGKVKTSGRGQKGQKSRGKIPFTRYSGGSLAFVKRLPFLRGKDKNNSLKSSPVVITLTALNMLPKGTVVTVDSLAAKKLINKKEAKRDGVKVLSNGDLSVSLTVKLPVSKAAKEKIEKAGGSVE